MSEGFCTLCGHQVASFDGLNECPNCSTKGKPCAFSQQVDVNINLHELRVLCIWAENWALRMKDESSQVIYAIANRLRKQFPDEFKDVPLTMREEFEQLNEAGFDFETNHPSADTPELGNHYNPKFEAKDDEEI